MSYQYGATHTAMSPAVRIRIAGLEAELARKNRVIRDLNARLRRRNHVSDVNHGRPYRDTLTPEELAAPPELRPGDTPDMCAARLDAINDESDQWAHQRRHGQRQAAA